MLPSGGEVQLDDCNHKHNVALLSICGSTFYSDFSGSRTTFMKDKDDAHVPQISTSTPAKCIAV